jgi:uncharacterized protein YegL
MQRLLARAEWTRRASNPASNLSAKFGPSLVLAAIVRDPIGVIPPTQPGQVQVFMPTADSHRTFLLPLLAAFALAGCGSPSTLASVGDGDARAADSDQDAGSNPGQGGSIVVTGADPAHVGGPSVTSDACNKADVRFESKVPAVFILVDRSSSMFERNLWEPLKKGVLSIVQQLDRDVRFGFSSYTGQAGGMCPELASSVSVAQDNFGAIKAAYDSVMPPKYKGETPTARSIDEVSKLLAREPEGTPKYILLVTDGEPDFCDDPNVTCARDAVVASAQKAWAQGIGTFIFSVGGSVDRAHLQDVANAGSGQGVTDRQMAVLYQCNGGTAKYGTETGTAPFYEPNVNDQSALSAALSSVVAGVRSCVFELSGKLQIDLNAADQGVVEIDEKRIAFGAPDGFRMNSRTQLELLGKACAELRKPEPKHVSIDFPCAAVLLF